MTDTDLDHGADLHVLMDRALSDLPVPTHRIHDASRRRGRAVRRRRRLGLAAGGLAATVAAAGLAWPSVSGESGADHHVVDPGPAGPRDADPRPAGWWNMPGAVMRDSLTGLLPDGMRITDANLGDEDLAPGDEPTGGWIAVDLADAEGRPVGGLNVVLYPPSADGAAFVRDLTTCPGNLVGSPEGTRACTELRDADGAVVGRTSRWSGEGVVVLETTRLTPEGAVIYAASSNSSDDKWGLGSSVDRTAPSLRLSDLRELASAPQWRSWSDRD